MSLLAVSGDAEKTTTDKAIVLREVAILRIVNGTVMVLNVDTDYVKKLSMV